MKFKTTLLVFAGSLVAGQILMAQPKPVRSPEAPVAPLAPKPPHAPEAPRPQGTGVPQPGFTPMPFQQAKPVEVRFDLDFPGGKPAHLVEYIEQASGKPLNAVIPIDLADMELPSLKMKRVTVSQLFEALTLASMKREKFVSQSSITGTGEVRELVQFKDTSYGFRTQSPGPDAVWYFFHDRALPPSTPPSVSRFYNLETAGRTYSVQDITTAVKTGWDLLGIKEQPALKYHAETKLLIAVGQPDHLRLIDSVLSELGIRPEIRPMPIQRPVEVKNDGGSPKR